MAAGALGADDCVKSTDACRAQSKAVTPFIAALKAAGATTPSPKAAKASPEAKQPATAPLPTEGPKAPAGQPASQDMQTTAPMQKPLSSPGWLIAVAALLAGLYYFLKDARKKRKK